MKNTLPLDRVTSEELSPFSSARVRGAMESLQSDTEEGWTLRDLLGVLERRWKLFLSIVGVSCILGLLYCLLATKLYTASVVLKIERFSPLLQSPEIERALVQQSKDVEFLQTQVALLTGLRTADYVLSRNDLRDRLMQHLDPSPEESVAPTPALNDEPETPRKALSKREKAGLERAKGRYLTEAWMLREYQSLFKVSPIPNTNLVKVSFTTGAPDLSQELAQAHAEGFIDLVREERHLGMLEKLNFLDQQAEELQKKVAWAEKKAAQYAERNGLFPNQEKEDPAVRELSELSIMRSKTVTDRIALESLLNKITKVNVAEEILIDDHSIIQSRIALNQAEAEYSHLRVHFSDSYPKVRELLAKMKTLKQGILAQRKQILDGLKTKYQGLLRQEEELNAQIERQKSMVNASAQRLIAYNILRRDYESLRNLHQSVLGQLKESQVAAAASGSNITISEHALIPEGPSSPKVAVVMLLSMLLGVSLGLAVAIFLESLDNTLKTIEEVVATLQLPLLGTIPSYRTKRQVVTLRRTLPWGNGADKHDPALAAHERNREAEGAGTGKFVTVVSSKAAASEAFRTVRTSILLSSADRPPQTIMVSSARRGEGKTTMITNLAITFAQAGYRTLLIDADIRQPKVAKVFRVRSRRTGLTDYLSGHADLSEIIVPTVVKDLHVIASGPTAPNPVELVGSKRMRELLFELADSYDHILIDAPPVLPVADSLVLSQIVNGVVFVVRSKDTERHLAHEALRRLRNVRAPLLGVVMNGIEQTTYGAGEYGPRSSDEEEMFVIDTQQVANG